MSCAQVAQLVEQRTENPRVGGSIPPLGTMKKLIKIKFPLFKLTKSNIINLYNVSMLK